MSTTEKGRPIFDRLRLMPTKPTAAPPKDTLELQADEIRKSWMERTPARPAK